MLGFTFADLHQLKGFVKNLMSSRWIHANKRSQKFMALFDDLID